MSGAQSISTRRVYGVQRVCRVWHRARSSVYARRQATRSPARCRRRGPIGAAPDDVLVAHLRRVLRSLAVSWRGLPKSLGEAVGRGDAHLEGAGAPVDARARPPSPAARGPRAWAEGARWDHHHRDSRRDVGHRHDGHRDRRRGGSRRLRGRRSLRDRVHRAPCRQARDPLRGPGADPPGHPGTLRGHRRRRGPRAASPARPRVELLGRRFPTGGLRSSASKALRASCGSPKATVSRSASFAR